MITRDIYEDEQYWLDVFQDNGYDINCLDDETFDDFIQAIEDLENQGIDIINSPDDIINLAEEFDLEII